MDATISVVAGLVAGGLGGFVMSLLGWLESGTPFDPRKTVATILVAVFTGVLSTVALVQTDIFTNPNTPTWQVVIAFVTIFGAAAGFGSMGKKAIGTALGTQSSSAPSSPSAPASAPSA